MPTRAGSLLGPEQESQSSWFLDEDNEYRRSDARNGHRDPMVAFLGWFSVGLGMAELLTPGAVGRLIGVQGREGLLRTMGAREIISGIGILSQPHPAEWLWSRVGGDMLDLSLLVAAMQSGENDRGKLLGATAAVAGVTALDVLAAQQLSSTGSTLHRMQEGGTLRVRRSISVLRGPEDVYRYWRNFENLPGIMQHLESVHCHDDRRSHWVAKAPAGRKVEWDAEIVDDRPSEWIAWRSLEGASIENFGSVRFRPTADGRGTVVEVELEYRPPAGALGSLVARLFGEEPEQQVADDLRRLKQILETGEIPTTDGQPSGRTRSQRHRNSGHRISTTHQDRFTERHMA